MILYCYIVCLPLPLGPRKDRQRVGLGIEHPLVQGHEIRFCEEEVQVLEPANIRYTISSDHDSQQLLSREVYARFS